MAYSFKDINVGDVFKTNSCGECKINRIGATSSDVDVEFIKTNYKTNVKYGNLKLGKVKDPYYPLVLNVGYVGVGLYRGSIGGKDTPSYKTWRNMLGRCYDTNWTGVYIGCTVCEEWKDFQVFSMWFYQNWVIGYHLDKDIKVQGNKVYSKDTCTFVSGRDNTLKAAEYKMYKFTLCKGDDYITYSNQGDAAAFIGVDVSCVCRVLNGKAKHTKGWMLSNVK